jgi:hypothetical protein
MQFKKIRNFICLLETDIYVICLKRKSFRDEISAIETSSYFY